MYGPFYGLCERPFDLTPNPRYLVATEIHREALANLQYALAGRKGITLLVGEAGSGKTTVIRSAIEDQPAATHCVHLRNPALTRHEFVEMLAALFGLSERARASKTALLLELEDLLRQRHSAQEATALIIDEAHLLSVELLEEVRLLANIETDREKLMSLVLAGQREISDRLKDPSLAQLKQRVELRCELRPLDRLETFAYVSGRISAAGGVARNLFSREAVDLIYQRSKGNPRTINVIADNALLAGLALQQRPVTAGLVFEVCQDFDIGPTAAISPPSSPSQPSEEGGAVDVTRRGGTRGDALSAQHRTTTETEFIRAGSKSRRSHFV
jgi:type II secretory pathway predicted ATPase ExeA